MDDFVTQGVRNSEHPPIDHRSRRSRGNGFPMANGTTKLPEKLCPSQGGRSRGKRRISGRDHGAANKLSKVVDVSQAEIIRLIFDAGCGIEDCCHVRGAEPVCDSHLVEIGVGNKGEQAAVLVLPSEAPDTGLPRSLKDRSLDNLTMNSAIARLWLFL